MIELATIKDFELINRIYEEIKEEMRSINNPQWGSTEEDYPNSDEILEDIRNKNLYKYVESGKIQGLICIVEDIEREYDELIKNSAEKAYIIHRLAIPEEYRKKHIATRLLKFVEEKAIENNIKVLKGDTEQSNLKMNNLFIKEGYVYKGIITMDYYPGVYNYYEKELERK